MNKAFMFVLVVITVAAVFWGIKTHLYNEGEVVNEDFEITGEIKKLDIDAALLNIKIEEGKEYKVEYKGDENFRPVFDYNENTGALLIKQNQKVKKANLKTDNKLTIEIPRDNEMDSFIVELAIGDLNVDDIVAKEISLTGNMGNIEVNKCSSEKISIEANMGDVEISKCDATDLDITNSMGNVDITLEEDVKDYSVEVSASLGDVRIGKEKVDSSYKQTGDKGTIKVECNLGNVDIK